MDWLIDRLKQRERETERQRDREDRDRETEREREAETERARARVGSSVRSLCHLCIATTHLPMGFLSFKLPPPPSAALCYLCFCA